MRLGSERYPAGLESDAKIKFATLFWIVSTMMVLVGITLVVGGLALGMGPVAFVCGVLLLWSGIVKIIVLRIWRATLPPAASSPGAGSNDGVKTKAGYSS